MTKDDEIVTAPAAPGTRVLRFGEGNKDREKARMLAIFDPDTNPGQPIENPPAQTTPFWCVFCSYPCLDQAELKNHRCEQMDKVFNSHG